MDWYNRARQFLVEVWSELKKTSWPNRSEVYGTTTVVIITVFLCAAFLFVVDLILSRAVDFVFNQFAG